MGSEPQGWKGDHPDVGSGDCDRQTDLISVRTILDFIPPQLLEFPDGWRISSEMDSSEIETALFRNTFLSVSIDLLSDPMCCIFTSFYYSFCFFIDTVSLMVVVYIQIGISMGSHPGDPFMEWFGWMELRIKIGYPFTVLEMVTAKDFVIATIKLW